MPQYQIYLCFGEEYPTRAEHPFQKLIMAHVSTHWGWQPPSQAQGPLQGRDTGLYPSSVILCLHRWSRCSHGSSSIMPSA